VKATTTQRQIEQELKEHPDRYKTYAEVDQALRRRPKGFSDNDVANESEVWY
jgi:hypothetical protein